MDANAARIADTARRLKRLFTAAVHDKIAGGADLKDVFDKYGRL